MLYKAVPLPGGWLGKDEDYGTHRIGSVTKTFTAFLAMKLVNDGVISLGSTCGDLIGDDLLKGAFSDPEMAKGMTLEQLLTHTSGLEYDDHPQGGPEGNDPNVKLPTLHARFAYQQELAYRYEHRESQVMYSA